ncbi:hypothetical protein ACXY9V_21565, partial [Escherichia coli]
ILRGVRQQQDEPGRFSICSRQAAVVLSAENDFLRDSGIGHIQCEPGGASIRRTVTFVGGITADNLLYQLRLMCVSALKLLGEELGDEV